MKTHEFCLERVGKAFTTEQIAAMDNGNGQPEPASINGGGWNCRHVWTPVVMESAANATLSVSGMQFSTDRDIKLAVSHAFSAIEAVHELPKLPPIPIVGDPRMREGGKYRWEIATGKPVDILINPKGDHAELTALLEIGHWYDHQALGRPGEFASVAHPALDSWRKAVLNTRLVERLSDIPDAGSLPWRHPDGTVFSIATRKTADSLLLAEELFSRSYAEYVSLRAGDAKLLRQIEAFSDPRNPVSVVPHFWEDEDFAPVAAALKGAIVDAGWKIK